MKSTELLNPRRSDISIGIKTRRLVHTHKLTAYYIHCGDTFLRCIIIALNCVLELLWQNTNLSLKGDTENYLHDMHSLITQKKNQQKKKEGSNWVLLVMKQQCYSTYLVKLTQALIRNTKRYTESARVTKWPT